MRVMRAHVAASCSTNASMRARARPCTSTFTRPSAMRSTRITVTTVPTR
jgi:hypothetical protein